MKIKVTYENTNRIFDIIFFSTLTNFKYNDFRLILSKYLGNYYYIGNWENEEECITTLKTYVESLIPHYDCIDRRLGDNIEAPMNRNRKTNSIGDGMGEISPINSIVGDINTPTSKTYTKVDATDEENDAELFLKGYEANIRIHSVTEIIAYDLIERFIVELNRYY